MTFKGLIAALALSLSGCASMLVDCTSTVNNAMGCGYAALTAVNRIADEKVKAGSISKDAGRDIREETQEARRLMEAAAAIGDIRQIEAQRQLLLMLERELRSVK